MYNEKLNIAVEDTCFDYIEEVYKTDSSNETIIICFIEPTGTIGFSTKQENYIELLEKLFNSQPKEYDYIKAGWVLRYNLTNPLINVDLEDMDFKEVWSDKLFSLEQKRNHQLYKEIDKVEELHAYLHHHKENKLFVRFDSFLLDKDDYREGVVMKVSIARYLVDNHYLFVFDERDTSYLNKELGIKEKQSIIDMILNGDSLLKDVGLTLFVEEDFKEIKEVWCEYLNYKDDLDFEEFLEKKNNLK